jgi:hypothetical protein
MRNRGQGRRVQRGYKLEQIRTRLAKMRISFFLGINILDSGMYLPQDEAAESVAVDLQHRFL